MSKLLCREVRMSHGFAYDFFIDQGEWEIFKNMCFRLDIEDEFILYGYTVFIPELKQYLDVIGCTEHTGPLDLWAYYCMNYNRDSNYLRIRDSVLDDYLLDPDEGVITYSSITEAERDLLIRIREAYFDNRTVL